jgi:hypothetical protein
VRTLPRLLSDGDQAGELTFLYENLSVLDSKASGLLTFNAVGLAAIAVWLSYVPLNFMHLILDTVFVLLIGSCLLCLQVVVVYWAPSSHLSDAESFRRALLALRNQRTGTFRRAWVTSLISIGLLLGVSVVHTVGTLMIATGTCEETCRSVFGEDALGLDGGTER